jgi:hypothetical protein
MHVMDFIDIKSYMSKSLTNLGRMKNSHIPRILMNINPKKARSRASMHTAYDRPVLTL